MTEPDNNPVFDPATDSDAPTEQPTSDVETGQTDESAPEAPTEVEQPQQPTPTPGQEDTPEVDATPAPDVPGAQDAVSDTANEFEVPSAPVTGVPTPGAVSDPKPEQTDNSERPEDGPQDVSQDPNEVPSNDEDPDVVA